MFPVAARLSSSRRALGLIAPSWRLTLGERICEWNTPLSQWSYTRLTMFDRRVCEVRLFGQHKFDIKQQKYKVSDELKEGQVRVLFGKSVAWDLS